MRFVLRVIFLMPWKRRQAVSRECPVKENVEGRQKKQMSVGPVLMTCFPAYLSVSCAMLRFLWSINIMFLCDMTPYSLEMGAKMHGVTFRRMWFYLKYVKHTNLDDKIWIPGNDIACELFVTNYSVNLKSSPLSCRQLNLFIWSFASEKCEEWMMNLHS